MESLPQDPNDPSPIGLPEGLNNLTFPSAIMTRFLTPPLYKMFFTYSEMPHLISQAILFNNAPQKEKGRKFPFVSPVVCSEFGGLLFE